MKKIMALTLIGLFGFLLVGCSKDIESTTTQANITTGNVSTVDTVVSSTDDTTENTTENTVDVCVADPFAPECLTQNNIVLSYADWGNKIINQALIDAFMEKYPNITVALRTDFDGLYGGAFTEGLINAQTSGVLPDVFSIDNVPTGVYTGMLADVSEYYDMDPDTQLVYPNIRDTAVYGDERLAIPSAQQIKGILLNITLFNQYGIELPEFDWTYDEFLEIALELRQAGVNDHVYAIEPLDWGIIDFESIFPTMDDASVGYNTWDGTEFHFSSQSWIDAFNLRNQAYEQELITGTAGDDWESVGDGVGYPWYEGYVGMKIAGTWNLGMVETMYEDYGQDVGFWPYPGGDAGQFPPVILDFTCVSSAQTLYPKEAYALAKWMTYGKEGWLERLSILEDQGSRILDRMPIADYPEVWAAADYFIYNPYTSVYGLKESVDLLDVSKPDVDKWLLGYKSFWSWVEDPANDYWTKIADGEVSPEVFAPTWEDKINEMVDEALAAYLSEQE